MTSELRPAVETRAEVVVEKLRALHVWPQIVADDHADLLTPRRIAKLYEIGRVSHEAADLIETQAREIERLRERWAMIDQLRGAEGCSVEIIHDNPDPGASNCAIYVTDNFGEDYSTYYGDTVDDCLRQAVEARAALGDSHDQ